MMGLRHVVWLAPLLLTGWWASKPALWAVAGALRLSLPEVSADAWQDGTSRLALQRNVQQHFRKYDIYIPLDDIMVKPLDSSYQDKLFLLLAQRCGHGSVYVWIPLIFRFPMLGHKVTEWCWIPEIKILRNTAD